MATSAKMREILSLAKRLGQRHASVLILGETGTGKEVVARAIHQAGGAGPFVPIDCSALNKALMESELFGHVKGAFTGAVAAKIGLLELAEGGTAFFDEIGEVPLDLQVKLLRVLQDQQIRPVGALAWRKVRFRIIAATNRDLPQEVERGTFRRDLFYRLNVVSLRLPPLRERKEDIPELVKHFLSRHPGRELAPGVMETLLSYDWPGNVRELENCIQHMVAVSTGPALELADLPITLQDWLEGDRRTWSHSVPVEPAQVSPVLPLGEVEKRTILDALAYTRGDRLKAARLLGIGRTTLYRKLRSLGAAVAPAPQHSGSPRRTGFHYANLHSS